MSWTVSVFSQARLTGAHEAEIQGTLILKLCTYPPPSQRRLGGQVRRHRRLPEGGGRRDHDKVKVSLRDLVRSLLPEADARFQREEPLVP